MRCTVGVAFAVALVASISSATAHESVKTGVLECRGISQQYVVASVTNLDCIYRPTYGGRPHAYIATIRRSGLDIGLNQSTVLAWAVFAPTHRLGRGSLSGTYVGASANATLGVGVGANALFGGSDNTFALQPVSIQGQTGVGAVGGVSALELRPFHRR